VVVEDGEVRDRDREEGDTLKMRNAETKEEVSNRFELKLIQPRDNDVDSIIVQTKSWLNRYCEEAAASVVFAFMSKKCSCDRCRAAPFMP
jgi:hypothetical protein